MVQADLLSRCEGSFLWLGCVIEELRDQKTCTKIKQCVDNLPRGLRPLYERLLIQIDEGDQQECAHILEWVAQAMEPLTLSELAEAVDIYESADVSREQAVDDRIMWCGSLLRRENHKEEDGTSFVTVALVHYSLKQYLFDNTRTSQGNISRFLLDSDKTHYNIALRCIEYLEQTRCNEIYWLCNSSRTGNDRPFTKYATLYWPSHARLIKTNVLDLIRLESDFFGENGMACNGWWWSFNCTKFPRLKYELPVLQKGATMRASLTLPRLHLVAALGMIPWIQEVIDRSPAQSDVANLLDGRGQSPVHHAIQHGHISAVKFLLNKGATIDERSVFGVCSEGHVEVLKLLLDNGGDPNARAFDYFKTGREQETALWEASGCGHEEIVRVLLDRGADPNALSSVILPTTTMLISRSPAFAPACHAGHKTIAEVLLSRTRTEVIAQHVMETFEISIFNKQDSIVRLLCPYVDELRPTKDGLEQSLYAARCTDLPMVTLLHILDYFKIDINTPVLIKGIADEGFSPILSMAMKHNDPDLALSLLQKGARVDSTSPKAGQAVHFAVRHNEVGILEQLRRRGVDMTALQDLDTSMHTAANSNSVIAAQYLYMRNVSVTNKNAHSQTPLHFAAMEGRLDMTHFLLGKGASVNSKDKYGKTALSWAAKKGHVGVVRAIVEHIKNVAST
jgi:ankyrin repeat protein